MRSSRVLRAGCAAAAVVASAGTFVAVASSIGAAPGLCGVLLSSASTAEDPEGQATWQRQQQGEGGSVRMNDALHMQLTQHTQGD
jgi:hypothetical protein